MKVEVDEEEDLLAGIVSDMTETGSEAEEEKYIPPKPPGRRQKIIRFLQCCGSGMISRCGSERIRIHNTGFLAWLQHVRFGSDQSSSGF